MHTAAPRPDDGCPEILTWRRTTCPSVRVDTSVGSLLDFYRHERRVSGRCPHCGEPFRLSEVKLTYGKEPPKDLIERLRRDRDRAEDEVEIAQAQLDDAQAEYDPKIEALQRDYELRLETVEQRWRDRADTEIQRRLLSRICGIRKQAISQSRATQIGRAHV